MPDSKHLRWLKEQESRTADEAASIPPDQPAANDADGWQQYRRWVTKAPAPRNRRVGIDPSLYSWRNYRNWTDEIKRSWPDDDS
jgi:hypothetical protein